MRAVVSSSPSVRHIPPDTPVTVERIRPHAHVAAGVSVYARYDPPDAEERSIQIRFDTDAARTASSAIEEGAEIEIGRLHRLRTESELTFIVPDTVTLLSKREHSSTELRRKLRRRGYGDDAIDYALETMQTRRYQDDRRFTREFIRQRMSRRPVSRPALVAALSERGIPMRLADEEIDSYLDTDPECFSRALQRAFRSMRDRESASYDTVLRRLIRRGFAAEAIKKLFD